MITLVFCLEEPSAREMLKGILPRLLPDDVVVHYMVFEGKQDLHKQLQRKIQKWLLPDSYFVVMRDQDSGDCRKIREELSQLCAAAGRSDSLVRIACHELESFYLGDLLAVESGLKISGLSRLQGNQKFRQPDVLANAAEELSKITQFQYQKVNGSRCIAPHMRLDHSNTSTSFQALLRGIRRLCSAHMH